MSVDAPLPRPYEAPYPIAFVFGCARSGTSILGELIGSHPEVIYLHEAHHIWRRAGEGEAGSHRLTARQATPEVARALRKRFFKETAPGKLLVEKNPRTSLRLPLVKAVFPQARLVHIVRDGRDVACSLLPGIGGEEWHHLKPPGWQTLAEEAAGIVRCALAWRQVMQIALDDLRDVDHLQVHYEELVADPHAVAARVFSYLGLQPTRETAAFCQRISNRTEGSYQAERQKRWFRPDHSVRVGRWRENLTDAEAERVVQELGPTLRRLGYEV